jgi:hypothetical protein
MARFYQIRIDSIYLTSDGSAGGTACKLSVPNAEDLLTSIVGVAVPAIGGGAVTQLAPWTSGKQFDVAVETVMEDVWTQLVDLILDALENDTGFTIEGAGDGGDFSVAVKPFPIKPFSFQSFINGRLRGVVLKFITV